MSEVREWTWYNCKQKQMVVAGHSTEGKCHRCVEVVHFVERAAYDSLSQQLEQARAECALWKQRCDTIDCGEFTVIHHKDHPQPAEEFVTAFKSLRAQRDLLRDALEFYDDENSWDGFDEEYKTDIISDDWEMKVIGEDGLGGKRARAAIKACEEIK